jgi:dipeptidyl aminopeptidase/acylaminoacyl peptidase
VTDDDESAATGLWVGRLDGPAFHVEDEPIVRADGPVDGRVLAWRSSGDQRAVSLVDTADGSEVEVLRTEDGGVPVLAPDGRTMYWIEMTSDMRGDVWRMRLPDGERELMLGDRATRYSSTQLSLDGRYLALVGGMDDPEHVVVVDTRSGETWDVRTTGGGVVGFLGRHLVTYSEPEGDEARFPLLAVDPRDGSTRTVARAGIYPAIVPDADGRGVLVWRTFDDQTASIRVRDSVGGRRRIIHTVPRSEARARSAAVVRRGFDQGIEIPGYVALFPDGHAFAWPEIAQRYAGQSRTLVSIADGSVIELDALEPSPAP